MADNTTQAVAHEWVSFPVGNWKASGHEALCPACREALKAAAVRGVTEATCGSGGVSEPAARCASSATAPTWIASALCARPAPSTRRPSARFQEQLPFEPVNEGRLAMLSVERTTTRGALLRAVQSGSPIVAAARKWTARHALQSILAVRPARALRRQAR